MDNRDHSAKRKNNPALPYIRNIYTALFASLTALLNVSIIVSGYVSVYNECQIDLTYPTKAILVTLLPVLVVFTVSLVYNYFDNVDLFAKREFFESGSGKALIARPPYIISFGIAMLFSTLLFTDSFHIALSFYFPGINIAVARFLAVAITVGLRIFQLWSLQDKWQAEIDNPLFIEKAMFKRNRDMYTFKPWQLILQPIGYFFVFTFCCAFISGVYFKNIIFPVVITGFNIMISPDMWWTVFIIPAIIVAVVIIFRLIYNITKRRILLKKLKQMESERLAKVEITGRKYLSASFITLPLTVKITDKNGEVYNCIVATCGEINAPMFFKNDEYIVEHGFHLRGGALMARGGSFAQAVDISQLGGKANPTNFVFGYRTSHKLKFPEGEGHKAVILNPTPTTAFVMEDRFFKSIDTGEVVGDYTIYTASGLFNHIERQSRKGRRDYEY
jgi:hypothetical protein